MDPAALARYRQWRRASIAVVVIGLALGLLAALATWGDLLILLGLAVAGMVAHLVNEWLNWFGVRLTRDGALTLTRVHPDFVDALRVDHPV